MEDSFVKIGTNFYQVQLFFVLNQEYKVLVKQIPISKNVECRYKEFKFTMRQYYIVDESAIQFDHLEIFDCEDIRKTRILCRSFQPQIYCRFGNLINKCSNLNFLKIYLMSLLID